MSASTKKRLRKEQNFAQLTEKQLAQQKEAKKLKITTLVFAAVILAILVVGIVTMAVGAYTNSGIAERNTVAMNIGQHKLSAADLSYFYMDGINTFYNEWYNNYGDYAATYLLFMMGLDVTAPLDRQIFDEETGDTFADYFADAAVNSAVTAYTTYDLALASGHVVSAEDVDATINTISTNAMLYGYADAEDYLKNIYGKGSTLESYRKYLEVITASNHYLQDGFNSFTYETADLEAHSAEHFNDYSSYSYATFTINPSVFLECTASEEDKEHVHSEEETEASQNAAYEAAQTILTQAPKDVEALNAAIKALEQYKDNEYAEATETDNALYTTITNTKIAQWLTAEGRKAGDLDVLTNETTTTDEDGKETTKVTSYTLIMMLGVNTNDMPLVNIRHILTSYTGGTQDENGNVTYSVAEKATAMTATQALEAEWKAAGGTEEAFIELAKSKSTDPGSASNGGLYEDVFPGQMVATFNDWCFDESRKPGDTGIVETDYGVHLMYYVSDSETTYRNSLIETDLRDADYRAWYDGLVDDTDYQVLDTSKLDLDMIISR